MDDPQTPRSRWMGDLPRYAYRGLTAALAILIMERAANAFAIPLPLVPFVTSIVLTVTVPEMPAARPYAVILGHFVSALAGFAIFWTIGQGDIPNALAVALATFAMLVLRALHPPAALDAFVVTAMGVGSEWLLVPVLAGALNLALYGRATYWLERRLFG